MILRIREIVFLEGWTPTSFVPRVEQVRWFVLCGMDGWAGGRPELMSHVQYIACCPAGRQVRRTGEAPFRSGVGGR